MTRSAAIMIVALVATMSFLGAAAANEKAEAPQSSLPTPMIVVDEAAGTMVIALPVDGELPECGDITAAFDTKEGYGPGDCIEIVIEHPSGKTNHGAIVSAAAKELHPSTLDGIKKGEIMRWVAKTGGGEGDGGEEPGTTGPSDGDDEKSDTGKSDEAPGQNPGGGDNPGNQDNPGNGNNGNGNSGNGNGNGNGNGKGPNG